MQSLFKHLVNQTKYPNCRALLPLFVGLLLVASLTTAEQVDAKILVVVSHLSNPALKIDDVKRLYSLKQKNLENKKRALLVMPHIDSPATLEFSRILYGLYPYQLQRTWDRAVFSGRGQAPMQKDKETDILNFVREHSDAIGYLYVKESRLSDIQESMHVLQL